MTAPTDAIRERLKTHTVAVLTGLLYARRRLVRALRDGGLNVRVVNEGDVDETELRDALVAEALTSATQDVAGMVRERDWELAWLGLGVRIRGAGAFVVGRSLELADSGNALRITVDASLPVARELPARSLYRLTPAPRELPSIQVDDMGSVRYAGAEFGDDEHFLLLEAAMCRSLGLARAIA